MNDLRGVLELVEAALALPEEEQESFIRNEASEDTELAREAQAIVRLQAELGDDTFLKSPLAQDEATPSIDIDEALAPELGNYRILKPIGRGGMAIVYLAEQREPVFRRVAIKILRTGIDNPDALARFQLEQQALASMDHPNVAKVFDSGTTSKVSPTSSWSTCPAFRSPRSAGVGNSRRTNA